MSIKPRFADLKCSKINFNPGDRVLVRTTHRLNYEDNKKLKKLIEKWAGVELEILIICILDLDLEIEHRQL